MLAVYYATPEKSRKITPAVQPTNDIGRSEWRGTALNAPCYARTVLEAPESITHTRESSLMIIWSGLGFLVPIITFVLLVLTEYAVETLFADTSYYQAHGWPKLVAFLIAGAIVWSIGTYLNRKSGRVLIDKETGQEVILRPKHALFFLKMEYWAPILFVLGIIFLFVQE